MILALAEPLIGPTAHLLERVRLNARKVHLPRVNAEAVVSLDAHGIVLRVEPIDMK
jgi:hypothetical protein